MKWLIPKQAFAVLGAAALAACGAGSQSVPTQFVSAPFAKNTSASAASPGWGNILFMPESQLKGSFVLGYSVPRPHNVVYSINPPSDSAGGVALDKLGNLYVTPIGSSDLWVYPPKATTPSYDINTGGQNQYVAVDSTGHIAVSATVGSSDDALIFQSLKSTSPCASVPVTSSTYGAPKLAYDKKGNLFTIYNTPQLPYTNVGEVTGGCAAKTLKQLNLNLSNTNGVYDLKVDAAGNLAVLTGSNGTPAVEIFAPGSRNASKTVPLTYTGAADDFAFTALGKSVWVVGNTDPNGEWDLLKFSYPAGGKPTTKFTVGLIGSVTIRDLAVSPPLPF